MAETSRLRLPLLEAGQAQKHMTVNEALARLDVFGGASAVSRRLATPPTDAPEGALYLVPAGATGAWAGHAGDLAARLGGGWAFSRAEPGRRLWIIDEGREIVVPGAEAASYVDVDITSGASVLTPPLIAAQSVVMAVSARVVAAIKAPGASGWRLGVEGGSGRYGAGYGLAVNSWAMGLTGQPQAYYAPTRLLIEPEGGSFESGRIRIAVHALSYAPPPAI